MSYVPTTEEVRSMYGGPRYEPEFDRWLAAHDAEVAAQALRDAASAPIPRAALNTRTDGLRQWLRDRADQVTKEDR